MSAHVLPQASEAVKVLGAMVAVRRRELGATAAEVADRVGITRDTLRRIERGDPGVAIGTVFTAAVVLDVPLWDTTDRRELAARHRDLSRFSALLPSQVRRGRVDDDF